MFYPSYFLKVLQIGQEKIFPQDFLQFILQWTLFYMKRVTYWICYEKSKTFSTADSISNLVHNIKKM